MDEFWVYYLCSLIVINIIFAVYVCRSTNNVYSVLVWLLVFFVLPVISHICYFFIGRGVKLTNRKKYLNNFCDCAIDNAMLENADNVSFADSGLNIDSGLVEFNIKYNKAALAVFNEVKLITDTDKFYDEMLNDISNAKNTINIQFFIYRNDIIGNRLRQLLEQKASQGVKVRLLLDSLGSADVDGKFFNNLRKKGGQVHFFLQRLSKLNFNYRNHRKMVILDNQIAYTGSANIGEEYTNNTNRSYRFFDIMMKLSGDIVPLVNLRFLCDWNYCDKSNITEDDIIPISNKITQACPMQLISSGPNTINEEIKHTYLRLLYNATSRIWISTPYYIPDDSFSQCINAAIDRGVEVKIFIPKYPDKKMVYMATNSHISRLVRSGAQVYKHPTFLHAKMLIVDDTVASIGTFNIDIRSFRLHFEHTLLIYSSSVIENINQIFLKLQEDSVKLDHNFLYNKPLFTRLGEGFMRLFSPLF